MTIILNINKNNPEKVLIRQAALILKEGGLVAFPTETVYGLGADAFNAEAVEKIFIAKGRPASKGLIAHIADIKDVRKLAKEVPKRAELLMDKFWPGSLTIVLNKSKIVPDATTAGLDTIAIRMPANKIALALIREAKTPIAAPSANPSGEPSPVNAQQVIGYLNGKVDVIIDGGKTDIGVASTVLDLTANPPAILRQGALEKEGIEKVLKGKIEAR